MLPITFSDDFFVTHPNAIIGFLEISNIDNSTEHDPFTVEKKAIQESTIQQFGEYTRADFNMLPIFSAYRTYYKKFKKSYHVQLQLESIALKGKSLPHVNPLVDINFMTEVQTNLLTAGHDVNKLSGPISMDISREGDTITQLNGQPRNMRVGDMVMRDDSSVSCSVIYGQDNLSPITKDTTHVLYVAYCPEGISLECAENHINNIRKYVLSINSAAIVLQNRFVYSTNSR